MTALAFCGIQGMTCSDLRGTCELKEGKTRSKNRCSIRETLRLCTSKVYRFRIQIEERHTSLRKAGDAELKFRAEESNAKF